MNLKPIKDYLDEIVDENLIPGACYAYVGLNGKWMTYSGYKQTVPTLEPNSLNTLYDLASCTKVVATTTAILLLLEQGKLSLKTKVSSVLPRFKFTEITIKDLLTHTSGLSVENNNYKQCRSKEQFIDYVYDLNLTYEPNTKVLYTDYNFILLGFIIEALTNIPIDQYVSKAIFEPLQMKDSVYSTNSLDSSCFASTEVTSHRGVIRGSVHDGKSFLLDGKSGNAGVFSNVSDLSNFIEMILSRGMFKGQPFLHSETIDLLRHCYTQNLDFRRTLGWLNNEPSCPIGDYYSNDMIFHTGFTGTSILIDFQRQCGFVLLTNRIHPNRDNKSIEAIRNKVANLTFLNS